MFLSVNIRTAVCCTIINIRPMKSDNCQWALRHGGHDEIQSMVIRFILWQWAHKVFFFFHRHLSSMLLCVRARINVRGCKTTLGHSVCMCALGHGCRGESNGVEFSRAGSRTDRTNGPPCGHVLCVVHQSGDNKLSKVR